MKKPKTNRKVSTSALFLILLFLSNSITASSISGIVKNQETGEPIPEYYVIADAGLGGGFGFMLDPYITTTNELGEYDVTVPNGEYFVYTIERNIPGDNEFQAQFWNHQPTPVDAEIISVYDENISDINFDLIPTIVTSNSISGQVTIEGSTPNFDVLMVAISSEEEWEETDMMQLGGNYNITNLQEGEYYILAISSEALPEYYGGELNFDNADPVYINGTVQNIDFQLDTTIGNGNLIMSGTVIDNEGNYVANTSILVENENGDIWSYAKTDNNGNYNINNLTNGNYDAVATKILYNSDIESVIVDNNFSQDFVINATVDIENNYELRIMNYELKQNYPNPFNPNTRINYELGIMNYELAEIVVYNTMGQSVWSTIVGPKNLSPGTSATNNHGSVEFDGSRFNSGIYYYSLVIDGKRMDTKSMILIK